MKVLRELEGITYWVLPQREIGELVNSYIRREWETDKMNQNEDPKKSRWLGSLPLREWKLVKIGLTSIKLNDRIMSYSDAESGYNFKRRLEERKPAIREDIEKYGGIIRPLVLRAEDLQLMDGYCRYHVLLDKGIKNAYAYLGSL